MSVMLNTFQESQRVAMEALAGQVASQSRMAENVAKAVVDRSKGEHISALMGIDFKPFLPVMNDSEADWETHRVAFITRSNSL